MLRLALCALSLGVANAARRAEEFGTLEADVDKNSQPSLLRNTEKHPHLVFVLADDLGRPNVGFAAKDIAAETGESLFEAEVAGFTPTLNALADDGIRVQRHYSFTSCTPSRMSMMSGRLPVHVGQILGELETWDGGTDPVRGWEGMPLNITTIGAKLKMVGYKTHLIGKADGFGGATPDHLPSARGFDTSLVYFAHANHNYKYILDRNSGRPPCEEILEIDTPFYDLFNGNAGEMEASTYASQIKNEDEMFFEHAIDIVQNHDSRFPLFLVLTPHTPHTNLDNPEESFAWTASAMCSYNLQCLDRSGQCSFTSGGAPVGSCALKERMDLLSSMHFLDGLVNHLTQALRGAGMWDDTLFVFASDNGGGIAQGPGGNNFPLKGGKGGLGWEGGFRTPALVSGGNLNQRLRGTSVDGVMHITDWYATFCNLVGAPIADVTGESVGVAPVDSMDMAPMLTGGGDVRDELHLSDAALLKVIDGTWYKLATGVSGNTMHQGPDYPNSTCGRAKVQMGVECRPSNPSPIGPQSLPYDCDTGCVYDIYADPGESNNLNQSMASETDQMIRRLNRLNKGVVEPWRGCKLSTLMCQAAEQKWQYHYGPFINVEGCDTCLHLTNEYWANPSILATTNECQCVTGSDACDELDQCEWSNGHCDLLPELAKEEEENGRGRRMIEQFKKFTNRDNSGTLF